MGLGFCQRVDVLRVMQSWPGFYVGTKMSRGGQMFSHWIIDMFLTHLLVNVEAIHLL